VCVAFQATRSFHTLECTLSGARRQIAPHFRLGVTTVFQSGRQFWVIYRYSMHRRNRHRVRVFMLAQILCCLPAFGQASSDTDDTVVILEVGAATNWNFNGGAATFAPNLAAECTPMENWLELEAGVSPFYTRNSTEWDTDFLFKKPWTLSKKAEFMVGVGPQWAHLKQNRKTTDAFSAELAGDFMFWPTGKHRLGWYLEPAYDYSFAGGHQQSIGMSAGLLIGIR
jgi:hypothetical protein